jgi:phosphate:Na+ symporter
MTIFNILSFIGGLALFLFGMNYMGTSLEKMGGGKFESILEKMTNNRIKGVLLGAGVTAVIQSSSAVTVMAVGFVNSGIMSLHQVIGIIMGANIGTTITSWILSLTGIQSSNIFVSLLKPSSFSPILALIGIILYIFFKSEKKRNIGSILLGFAVLMFGMDSMSSAVAPLKEIPQFTGILTKFSNPILGVLAGALLTAIIQSSSASIGILQALASTGFITVSSAFPIILGQNIGTCVTALLSSIGTGKNAKRTAVVHLAFNSIGVIASMIIFYSVNSVINFAFMQESINAFAIALIHTIFNVFSTLLLFPFGRQLEKLACLIITDKKDDESNELIDERFLLSPSYAIDKAKEKCDKMGLLAQDNITLCLEFVKKYSHLKDEKIIANEKELDNYEDELETYLMNLSSKNPNIADSIKISKLTHAIANFERIGDYGVNILKVKQKMHKNNIHFSLTANNELEIMSSAVSEIVNLAVTSFINDDEELAKTIEPLEQVIDNLKAQLRTRHAKRIDAEECSIENGMLFFDIINSFERIADHCSNLAVCIIELSHNSYKTHSYLAKRNQSFINKFEEYLVKYRV